MATRCPNTGCNPVSGPCYRRKIQWRCRKCYQTAPTFKFAKRYKRSKSKTLAQLAFLGKPQPNVKPSARLIDVFNRYLPTTQKVWNTPYFVSALSNDCIMNQWISVVSPCSLDRGKAKSKDISHAWMVYSLELLLVAPMVLYYGTQLERFASFRGQNRPILRPCTSVSDTEMKQSKPSPGLITIELSLKFWF